MAHSDELVERLRIVFQDRIDVVEKKDVWWTHVYGPRSYVLWSSRRRSDG